jgi:hypothetical protein
MKSIYKVSNRAWFNVLLIVITVVVLCGLLAPLAGANTPPVTINVVNNSQKEIRHLFLASAAGENWGDDQLSQPISAGTSRNINADWNESTVKLVAEDEDGCFLKTTIDTSGTPTWTITSSTARDCGY